MKKLVILVSIIVFVSGCTQDTGFLIKDLPAVETFLDQNPDGKISISKLDKERVESKIDELKESCPELEAKQLYQVDLESDTAIKTLYIDVPTLKIECEVIPPECTENNDCSETQSCTDGECNDLECQNGYVIIDHRCVISPPENPQDIISMLMNDDAIKGDINAPITIVEFSDFQCPYCSRFFDQTLPSLKEKYIDTGIVRLVYRDFPLSFHPQAQKASEASECASDQGKFWEMHDLLYQNQDALSDENYKKWAADLGLNQDEFDDCLDSGKYFEEVQIDIADGVAATVTGTPAFFVAREDGTVFKLVGAQPIEVFDSAISELQK